MNVAFSLRHYIVTEIMHELDVNKLSLDEPLIEGDIIDSMSLIKLVAFMKEKFGVDVGDDELDIENFRTVNALTDFIDRKMKSR